MADKTGGEQHSDPGGPWDGTGEWEIGEDPDEDFAEVEQWFGKGIWAEDETGRDEMAFDIIELRGFEREGLDAPVFLAALSDADLRELLESARARDDSEAVDLYAFEHAKRQAWQTRHQNLPPGYYPPFPLEMGIEGDDDLPHD